MKQFLICGFLLFALCVYLTSGSTFEERRLREGNSFSRRLRSCNLFCSLKGSRGSYNQTRCYKIPSQNAVVTDCVFRCLRTKGESPIAEECECRNGVCIPQKPTTTPDNTEEPTPEPPATTEPPEPETENPPTTTATPTDDNEENSGKKVNQGKKGVKGQNSNNGNQSKRKP